MKLYGSLASPYVGRIAMLLRLHDIDLPLNEIEGGSRSEAYRAINPLHKMPALQDGDLVVVESEVICEYLNDRFPDKHILPADPAARARSRMISRMVDLYVAPHNSPLIPMRDPAKRDQAVIDAAAANYAKGFGAIEHFMQGRFAACDEPSVADCALVPFMIMLKTNTFARFDEIQDPTHGEGKLADWWKQILEDSTTGQFVQDYQEAFDAFMVYLMKMIAQRQGR